MKYILKSENVCENYYASKALKSLNGIWAYIFIVFVVLIYFMLCLQSYEEREW